MVLERDNWTCQKCEKRGGHIHCHHIDPVILNPIESADLDNCITLCKKCHKWVHTKEGCRYFKLRRCA
jgi:thymidylate synthase (FAD)